MINTGMTMTTTGTTFCFSDFVFLFRGLFLFETVKNPPHFRYAIQSGSRLSVLLVVESPCEQARDHKSSNPGQTCDAPYRLGFDQTVRSNKE